MAYLSGGATSQKVQERYAPHGRPFLGDVVSSALALANSSPIGVVTTPVTAIVSAVKSLFGTGDTSPFQDKRVGEMAQLAAQGVGYEWAWQWLAGLSGRYGIVQVNGGRTSHWPMIAQVSGSGSDIQKYFLGGASQWGNIAAAPWTDAYAGPTGRYGSQDLAWQALQKLGQLYNVVIPQPAPAGHGPGPHALNGTNNQGWGGGDNNDQSRWPTPFVWNPVLPVTAANGATTGLSNPAIAANVFGTPNISPSTPPGQSGLLTAVANAGTPGVQTSGVFGGMSPLLIAGLVGGFLLLKRKRG